MELSPRLALVASLITPGASLADVGTDHGYLPVWLAKNGVCGKIIATDIREKPLERGRQNARHYGVSDKIDFRLCSGLSRVGPEEVDEAAICGMGGDLIAAILASSPWALEKRLILQPASSADDLRGYLYAAGYEIISERLVMDGGMMYNILVTEKGEPVAARPADLYLSPALFRSADPLLPKYLDRMTGILQKAEAGAAASSKPQDKTRRIFFKEALEGIIGMRKELEHDDC